MRVRLGLGKQTNMWRAGIRGWLYRHDWHLAGLLAVAIVATAGFLLWPRPVPVGVAPAVISADDVEAAQERVAAQHPGLVIPLAEQRAQRTAGRRG